MTFQKLFTQILFLLSATALGAQDQNPRILFEQGEFTVAEHANSDQGADLGMCIATLENDAKQRLTFRGYQDNFFFMRLEDDRWQLTDRDVSVILDSDGEKVAIKGWTSALENVIFLYFDNDANLAKRVLDAVAGNKVLRVSTYSGKLLAEFSTREAKRAIPEFRACWERVQTLAEPTVDPFAEARDAFPDGLTSRDNTGVIYSITQAKPDILPEGTTGALFRSNNMSGSDHVSFAMYSNCSAFSLVQGWGNWEWANGGFFVNFTDQFYTFKRGETPPNLGSGCAMQ